MAMMGPCTECFITVVSLRHEPDCLLIRLGIMTYIHLCSKALPQLNDLLAAIDISNNILEDGESDLKFFSQQWLLSSSNNCIVLVDFKVNLQSTFTWFSAATLECGRLFAAYPLRLHCGLQRLEVNVLHFKIIF